MTDNQEGAEWYKDGFASVGREQETRSSYPPPTWPFSLRSPKSDTRKSPTLAKFRRLIEDAFACVLIVGQFPQTAPE
jgi:hypothetical protein